MVTGNLGGNLISSSVGSGSAGSRPPHGIAARKYPSNQLALQLVELFHLLLGRLAHDSGQSDAGDDPAPLPRDVANNATWSEDSGGVPLLHHRPAILLLDLDRHHRPGKFSQRRWPVHWNGWLHLGQ